MKSFAREGDREEGGTLVLMTQTLRPATDTDPHTIDYRALARRDPARAAADNGRNS
jgi:hypothetical protein